MTTQDGLGKVGIWIAIGAVFLVISSIWHGVIHPGVGATASDSMIRIAEQASAWGVAHLFFAIASAIFSASALVVVCSRSRLTERAAGIGAWSLLVVLGGMSVILTTMEATAEADAAVAGNLSTFSMWFSLSRGFEIVGILLPISLLSIAWSELRAVHSITPRWSSAASILGAGVVVVAIVGASWLRIEFFGPLFIGAALPMLWLVWLGVKLIQISKLGSDSGPQEDGS